MDDDSLNSILKLEMQAIKQIKLLGKNLLDLSQIVEDHINRGKSPIDSETTYHTDSIESTYTVVPPEHSKRCNAILVEGNYTKEWAYLSRMLFQLDVLQSSVGGETEIIAVAGNELEKYDIVFMPKDMDIVRAFQIQDTIKKVNPNASFVAVGDIQLHEDYPWWSDDHIGLHPSIDQLGGLIQRHL